jgi:hypothetical protein
VQFPSLRPLTTFRALVLLSSLLLAGCFMRPAPTETIRYHADGRLALVELRGQTWPEFFDIVRRESGFSIHVSSMPSGGITLRVQDYESWEQVLDTVATAKNYQLTRTAPNTYNFAPKP